MPDEVSDSLRNKPWILPALLVGAGVYLYANLFAWPDIPYLLSGDQIFFWTDAQRMLHGERIYQDFFRFTPPGTDLIYLAVFKIFGPQLWVTNAIVLITGVALCWVCFSIASRLMDQSWAMLTALLFLVFIYGRLLNATHHWFNLLVEMCATRLVMLQTSRLRIAAAGFLLAIASFFTQTAGPVCAIAIVLWLIWKGVREGKSWHMILLDQIPLALVFLTVFGAFSAYCIAEAGWKPLWELLVVYPRYQAYWFGRLFPGLPDPLTLRNFPHLASYLFVYALLPVIYPLVLWYCWSRRKNPVSEEETQLVPVSLIGMVLVLKILPAVNWLRVYCISMPGLILLMWTATRAGRIRPYLIAAGSLLVVCIAASQTWSKYHQGDKIVQLPAGKTMLQAQKYEQYSWIMEHTRPGDFFLSAAWPGVYFPLALRSPIFAEMLLNSEWTRPEYVERAIREVDQKEVKYILWSERLNSPDDPSRPWEDHLGPFRAYLKSHYRQVQTFAGGDQIWERN